MIRKHINIFLGLSLLSITMNANALLFTSDTGTAVYEYGDTSTPRDIMGEYGIGGGVYANGFIETLSGITMTIDNPLPALIDSRYLSDSEGVQTAEANFIAAPHGFFAGRGISANGITPGSSFGDQEAFDVATSFTIQFSQDVILNWISFDNLSGRALNESPLFNINGGTNYTALDVILDASESNHDISDPLTQVSIGETLLGGVDYTFNVLPQGLSTVDSLAEFWGWDVTAAPAAVPLPAAAWFMLSGLGALFGFGRKKYKKS